MCVCQLLSHVRLFATPQTVAPPGPSVHGILQARSLEWVTISFSNRNYSKKESEVAQSCSTLCDPMDCSLPGPSVHGIFQARVLERVAISFSKRNQYSHYGKQCGDFLKNCKQNFHMTQQSHFWAYTPRKADLKETRAPQCSLQHCLSQPGHGSNLDAHQQTNG